MPLIHRLTHFIRSEAAGGIALIAASVLALVLANLPMTAPLYAGLLNAPAGPAIIPYHGPMTPLSWINDGLMALFFLLVGLEIKREATEGALADPRARRAPIIAAAAGMMVPALVYLAITAAAAPLARGWAIPAATDIAFALAVLTLLGRHVPASAKLLLTTIAVVDDIGAVAIIALAYTDHIVLPALAGACAVAGVLFLLSRRGEARAWPYLIGFAAMWGCMIASGVHATIAGVATAFLIPSGATLQRIEHALAPIVAFAILPLFGLANAGVDLRAASLSVLADPLVLGIAGGLFLGKQAGIFGALRLADALGVAPRPEGVRWTQLYGVALVAGIGFTMSLFVGGLAFPGDSAMLDRVKIGVLAGSLLSALAGAAVLRVASRG